MSAGARAPGAPWYRNAVFLPINGERPYRWRAVAQDATVLDIFVQRRRHKQVAKQWVRKLLKGLPSVPRGLITDTLKSYGAARDFAWGRTAPESLPQ